MNLPIRIREIRKEHHLSQEQFAQELGVTRQAVSKWELGDAVPDIDNILAISKTFNVTLDYLLLDETNLSDDVKDKKIRLKYNNGFIGLLLCLFGLIILLIAAKYLQFREFEVFGEYYNDWKQYLNIAPLVYVKIMLVVGMLSSVVYLLFPLSKRTIKNYLNNTK